MGSKRQTRLRTCLGDDRMKRAIIMFAAMCCLAACADVHGKPLPLVDKKDPTFALVQDHLDAGALPK
jgi:hypothetical protein